MGAGPLAVPSGNPGANANSLAQVREAIKILQEALPGLPMGSDPWKAVNSAMSSLGRHVSSGDEVPGIQKTTQQGIQKSSDQQAMLAQVMKSLGGGGPAAGAPGAAPGLTPGGAAPGAPSPMAVA